MRGCVVGERERMRKLRVRAQTQDEYKRRCAVEVREGVSVNGVSDPSQDHDVRAADKTECAREEIDRSLMIDGWEERELTAAEVERADSSSSSERREA